MTNSWSMKPRMYLLSKLARVSGMFRESNPRPLTFELERILLMMQVLNANMLHKFETHSCCYRNRNKTVKERIRHKPIHCSAHVRHVPAKTEPSL